jgi:UDP-N-acetylglucosamine 2-epimerase (non-hydrolysing)/GDP/UDP-N,N'-diacetylbacillosamine 2-epimerase (hydrolysing)
MYKLSEIYNKINPDLVIVTGDRAEMLIAAITAAYMNIPIGHIQAGDLSGHIDGSARHSITKISHLHFASCKDSADRVIKMGEQKWRVFNTGAPQLDGLKDLSIKKTNKNLKKFGLIENEKFFLIIFHPVLYSSSSSSKQIQIILESLKNFKIKKFIIYPNIDTGYNDIINKIREYENKYNFVAFKNLKRDVFLSLLKKTTALIGNSSTGILEAPTFKIPVVNIGDRQRGRIQSDNIINCQLNKTAITNAINKIFLDKKFKNKLKKCQNLYGNGESSKKIVKILKNIKINKKLLDKEMTY